MARCPFAIWLPISGSAGEFLGGPYKIVHHTTEGSSAEGAIDTFRLRRSDPHFTVDSKHIYQHIDTSRSARALRNPPGGVETNRDSAIQIELVGFAHLQKSPDALANVARLCRWIETEHGVPNAWPAGFPKSAKNGKDPGGHMRDATLWDTKGGHYGHCHVPENTHWDPGYLKSECEFLRDATFDAQGKLRGALPEPARAPMSRRATTKAPLRSTMPDHDVVAVGASGYVENLLLSNVAAPFPVRARTPRRATKKRAATAAAGEKASAVIDVGAVVSFVDGVGAQVKDDVIYSIQFAQRGASGVFDRFTQQQAWYGKYIEILENLGWATEQLAFSQFDQHEGELRMDQAALKIITAIATQNQLLVLRESISALEKLAEGDGTIRLFDFHSSLEGSGNFQLGSVEQSKNGALSMAMGAFYFRSLDERRRFLFFKWGHQKVHFWTSAQRMTLNSDFYARVRDQVVARLAKDAPKYVAGVNLAGR